MNARTPAWPTESFFTVTAVSIAGGLFASIAPTFLGSVFGFDISNGSWVPAGALVALVVVTLQAIRPLTELSLLVAGVAVGFVVGSATFLSTTSEIGLLRWQIVALGGTLGVGHWLGMMFFGSVSFSARQSTRQLALPTVWIFWMLVFAIGVFVYHAYLFPEDWRTFETRILLIMGLFALGVAGLLVRRPTDRALWVAGIPLLVLGGFSIWILLLG